jgi:hypothetical protein
MASNLTVAEARLMLGTVADPDGSRPELFIPLLNEAQDAIIGEGQWKGLLGEVNFNSSTGFITLPRRWESVVADRMCYGGAPVFGRYHEFSSMGPCYFSDLEWRLNCLIDQGEWPTQVYQPEALPIRITIADADDEGETIRLYGIDASGNVIFDSDGREGIDYTTVLPSVTTSESFILTNVVKPTTEGTVTVSSVDGATVTALSTYEPTETNPLYRRYKVGTHEARDDGAPVIRTLCKRRFVPVVHETDLVFPSNVRALRFAMNACKLEAQGAYEVGSSIPYWEQCFRELNNSLRQARGNIRTPGAFLFPGSAGAVPQTR